MNSIEGRRLYNLDSIRRKQTRVTNIMFAFFTLCLMLLVIFNLTVAVCSVDGESMTDTLFDKETILLEKNVQQLKHGDIITISHMSTVLIIKRVIGLEGDKLVFKQSERNIEVVDLYRSIGGGDYIRLEEEYIKEPMDATVGWNQGFFRYKLAPPSVMPKDFEEYAVEIKEGEVFVMGDNRNDSKDSRHYGAGKVKYIEGRMIYEVKKDSVLEKILLFVYRERD